MKNIKEMMFNLKDEFAMVNDAMGYVEFGLSEEKDRQLSRLLNEFFIVESHKRIEEFIEDEDDIEALYNIISGISTEDMVQVIRDLY